MPDYLPAADITIVKVLEKAEIDKDKILLGEIAKIKGENQTLVQRLRAIVIGKSPLPGKSFSIDDDYIEIRLKQNGIDLSQIKLQAAEKVGVTRSFVEIPKERIEKIVLDHLYRMIPWERDKVKIKNIRASQKVILPKGKITYRIVPPKNTDYLGSIPVSVYFEVNKHFEKRAWVTVKIEVLTEVVVTKRPLGRNKLVTLDDIHLKKRDLADLPSDVITSFEDVLGRRTKRTLSVNVVLRPGLIELPPLVKRGDVVMIIAESDSFRITTLGEAKARGCRGDRIKVLNLDSKKSIYARVVDSNRVRVDF
jgi:flagella basal body P-ring formation protein FlgA